MLRHGLLSNSALGAQHARVFGRVSDNPSWAIAEALKHLVNRSYIIIDLSLGMSHYTAATVEAGHSKRRLRRQAALRRLPGIDGPQDLLDHLPLWWSYVVVCYHLAAVMTHNPID